MGTPRVSSLFRASMTHVGVQASYASSDILNSDVLWEFLRTSPVSSTSSTEVGRFSVDATKTSNTEALYRTIAHVSLSTTTSEVLMQQTTSFLHLPPRCFTTVAERQVLCTLVPCKLTLCSCCLFK